MARLLRSFVIVCGMTLLLPAVASAQAAIAGVVKDSSGAALPGVTVEAASSALIERVRTAVTDGAGQYRILDLRPGTYDVTITMQGFKTVRRANIVLEGNFTAQVNADLELGTLEETITVTGETPIVDVVNTRQSYTVNREMLDVIPTTRSLQARAALIPGTTVTAGALGQTSMTIHGSTSADQVVMIDGMRLNNLCGQGQFSGIYLNDAMAQEITYDTGGMSAEVAHGGLRVNMIPKEGGNTYSGSFFMYGASGPLQSDNRTPELRAFIPDPPGIEYTYEVNPSFGGPIKRNKLWFYFTYKYQDNKTYVANTYFRDGTPAFNKSSGNYSAVTRLTWQATPRNKFRIYIDKQYNGGEYSGVGSGVSPEASHKLHTPRAWTPQVKWTSATTSRLMLEAGITLYDQLYRNELQKTVGPRDLPERELSVGGLRVAGDNPYESWTKNYSSMIGATYITGSHALKTGMTLGWGKNSRTRAPLADIQRLHFQNDTPAQVVVRNTPLVDEQVVNADLGIYGQDSWTLKRLTLNVGARYDHFNAEVPAQSAPAGTWVPARQFNALENVPNWHDWAVRIGGAYDLFGTGKTALKANISKYVASEAAGFASQFNPMSSQTETRTWRDLDGNRSILDAQGNVQRNEVIGGTSNFGLASGTSRPDPNLARGYNWEQAVSVQHELLPRVSISGGYYHRTFYNLRVSDNLNLAPSDWTEFTIRAPQDQRLPNGGGYPVTMFTLNPAKVGSATDTLVTYSTSNSRVYDGVELSTSARIGERGFLLGGITSERTNSMECDVRDNPNSFRFCERHPPFRTLYKLSGAYTLPYDFQISGNFIARPGGNISANYTVNSAIAGRSIIGNTAGSGTITVNLVEPDTMYLDYIKTLDLRLARTFRFGRFRAQGLVDIYNLFNVSTITSLNETYGTNPATNQWLRPQVIIGGRYVRLGTQIDF